MNSETGQGLLREAIRSRFRTEPHAGRVDVAWTVVVAENGARRLVLDWQESGGPPVQKPGKRGFGTSLIKSGVSRELDGKVRLDFAAEGLRCILDVPLDGYDRFISFGEVAGVRPVGTP